MMEQAPQIVLLNGVGSAGKTSIAKALQRITSRPFLHVAMDAFLEMLPASYLDHSEGLKFEPIEEAGARVVAIRVGAVAGRALNGMRHAVAALADQGNDLILDEVLVDGCLGTYEALLSPFRTHLVGVMAPLAVLEERERNRGDRLIGLARWQYDRVHKNMRYDLTVDTSIDSPDECAERIKSTFAL